MKADVDLWKKQWAKLKLDKAHPQLDKPSSNNCTTVSSRTYCGVKRIKGQQSLMNHPF